MEKQSNNKKKMKAIRAPPPGNPERDKNTERLADFDTLLPHFGRSASLEPSGLDKMVRDIRAFEEALGDGVKRIYEGEIPMREKLRRLQ